MSTEHSTEFRQAKELTFEDIALRVSNQCALISVQSPARIEAIELTVGGKKVVWIALNIPDALDVSNGRKFIRHDVVKKLLFQ